MISGWSASERKREREGEPLTEDELAEVQMHMADGQQEQAYKKRSEIWAADDPIFAACCFDMMQVRFTNMFKYCPVIAHFHIEHPKIPVEASWSL